MTVKKYNVLSRVNHDNIDFEVSSSIELDDDQAEPLLKVNAIAISESQDKTPAPEGEARVVAIKEAIAKIDVADTGAWAKDGKPKTEAIAAITGWPISAAERNEIWETFKPSPVETPVVADAGSMSAAATTETTA